MVSQSMQEGTKTRHERDVVAAQLVELEKKYRRPESQASCRIEPNFADRLTEELLKLPDSLIGAILFFLTGFFQTDLVVADHTLLGNCGIVFGNDAAFSFLAGRNYLQVHEFKYLWKTDELSNFMLKTGFRSMIMAALEASNELTVEKNLRPAVYPLIDEMDALLYRCVISAMIGCDTLPGGVYGLGAKQLHVLIDQKKPINANAVIGIVITAKKGRVTETELRVVIDALMYEPCNMIELSTEEEKEAADGSNYQDSIRYMFPPPESLDKYLGGFASSGVTVTENVIVAECHSHTSLEPHDFLVNIGEGDARIY
jgi:hypothetical protein